MRAIPALFAVLILATVAPTLAPSQPPTPPVPVVAPLAEITPTVESATVALVDGKWIDAEVRRISARICVDGDAKFVQLRVRKLVTVTISGQTIDVVSAAPVDVIELVARDGRCYGITAGQGRYQVEVIASDPERGISIESVVVKIGDDPPDPDPDDPDPPDVPEDQFDNLGRRAANLSAGLPKRKELGQVYFDAANKLASGEHTTINDAAAAIRTARAALIPDASAWADFEKEIQADFDSRWPMSRGLLVEYWRALAVGLGVSS